MAFRNCVRNFLLALCCVGVTLPALFVASSANAQPAECFPSDMLLLIDRSGSMRSNNKWSDSTAAFTDLLTNYTKQFRFGLVTYGSTANLRVRVGSNTAPQCLSILRSMGPSGSTAMKCSLQIAYQHFQTFVIPNDSLKTRKRFVLMITDGVPNTCGTDVVPAVRQLRNIVVAGKRYDVKTYVIGFGSGVNASQLQQMAQAGGTKNYYRANNLASLKKILGSIASGASKEICDGKDNDCDGKTDDLIETCQGQCGSGQRVCNNGSWSKCSAQKQPSKEICNNLDDDCNGKVDDLQQKNCSTDCGKGTQRCRNGKWSECNAPKPKDEICDGKDNNCNGQVDERLTQKCKSKCGSGSQSCIQGDWSTCTAPEPVPVERCDGVDNNCDGKVDEGAKCPNGGRCKEGSCQDTCSGECRKGYICDGGYCKPKACNPACPNGQICRAGACVNADCTTPSGACGPQEICRNRRCIRNPCLGIQCAQDQFCIDGKCRISCARVRCAKGETCRNGTCVSDPCASKVCTRNASCINGKCVPNACSKCPTGQFCLGSQCVDDPCKRTSCPSGQTCVKGECYDPNGPLPPNNTNSGSGNGGNNAGTNAGNNSGSNQSGNNAGNNTGNAGNNTGNAGNNSGSNQSGNNAGNNTGNAGNNTGNAGNAGNNAGNAGNAGANTGYNSGANTGANAGYNAGNAGNNSDNGAGNAGGNGSSPPRDSGCVCAMNSDSPTFPLSFLLVFLFLGFVSRRR